jgi:AcrR family transcriptional regulator
MQPALPASARSEDRSADILAAIRSTFAEKGFDGASMQDLARAAHMSVGNFYRYFPSKADIVAQMVSSDLAEIEEDFASVMSDPDPFEALRHQARLRIEGETDCTQMQLWAEISAIALRKPEIGLASCNMESTVAGYLMQVFSVKTGLPLAEVEQRFAAHAAYFVLLIKATTIQPPADENLRKALNNLILRSIDQTLAEVASAAVKGS